LYGSVPVRGFWQSAAKCEAGWKTPAVQVDPLPLPLPLPLPVPVLPLPPPHP
jgi:hypothetical protein